MEDLTVIEVGPGPHLWAGGVGKDGAQGQGEGLLGSLHPLLIRSLGKYLLGAALCKALL